MPDITMCFNEECIKKKECYRYIAIPSHYQSYANFKPISNKEDDFNCKHYWPNIKANLQ